MVLLALSSEESTRGGAGHDASRARRAFRDTTSSARSMLDCGGAALREVKSRSRDTRRAWGSGAGARPAVDFAQRPVREAAKN
jgi:hypothetical protein